MYASVIKNNKALRSIEALSANKEWTLMKKIPREKKYKYIV